MFWNTYQSVYPRANQIIDKIITNPIGKKEIIIFGTYLRVGAFFFGRLYPDIEYVNRLMTHSWGQRVVAWTLEDAQEYGEKLKKAGYDQDVTSMDTDSMYMYLGSNGEYMATVTWGAGDGTNGALSISHK